MLLVIRKLYYTCAFYRPSYSGQAIKQNGRAQRNCSIWKGKKLDQIAYKKGLKTLRSLKI